MARTSRLPIRAAQTTGILFMLLALVPYLIIGPYWGMLWFYLCAPVSFIAESAFGIGIGSHFLIFLVTLITALLWAGLAYWIGVVIVSGRS